MTRKPVAQGHRDAETAADHGRFTSYAVEYRKCGKKDCWCAKAARGRGHGPYRYSKRRRRATVTSIYRGKHVAGSALPAAIGSGDEGESDW